MRAERLLSSLLLLQAQGQLSAHQLAERLTVSERTIQRDMEALSMAGIPVLAERGRGGGWALMDVNDTTLAHDRNSKIVASKIFPLPSSHLSILNLGRK